MTFELPPRLPAILAVLSATVFLGCMPTVHAAPVVKWVPAYQTLTVIAGQTSTTAASFTASKGATNVSVRVVPALARFVTASPSRLVTLHPGGTSAVTFVATVPIDTLPQVIEGAVQLRLGSATMARPLPFTLRIEWPQLDGGGDLGIKVAYPPSWYQRPRDGGIAFSNVLEPGEVSDASFKAESFFLVHLHTDRNPNGLSLGQWFDEDLRPVISESILYEEYRVIDGHSALYTETSGVGGRRAHYYILRDSDVLEITYGLFEPKFLPYYEAMLTSLSVVE